MDAGESLSAVATSLAGSSAATRSWAQQRSKRLRQRRPALADSKHERAHDSGNFETRRRGRVLPGSWSTLSRAEASSLNPTPFLGGCQGGRVAARQSRAKTASFFELRLVSCRRRILELRALGICGRLQPKLLKSRRREVWCLFLTRSNRTYVRTIWNSKPQMPRVWRCGFFVALVHKSSRIASGRGVFWR